MSDPLAAERRPVKIVNYDRRWPGLALVESARLSDGMGAALIRVEHVGSTSVRGLGAKPIIDLCPVVTSLSDLDRRRKAVEALGYLWRGEFGVPERRYCSRDIAGVRRFQLHCFAEGAEELGRMLDFRDYLRADDEEARSYEAEKRKAAAMHPSDSLAYNDAKSAWIVACRERAMAWAKARALPADPHAQRRDPEDDAQDR
jgi:GrpB-like predicted nucleotidyltransferase (UPF0157 family)